MDDNGSNSGGSEDNQEREDDKIEAGSFSATFKNLAALAKELICVRCGNMPKEKVFVLGYCHHKHCEDCIEKAAGQPCVNCGKTGYPKAAKQDLFTSSVLVEIPALFKVLKDGGKLQLVEGGSGMQNEGEEESVDSDEVGVEEPCPSTSVAPLDLSVKVEELNIVGDKEEKRSERDANEFQEEGDVVAGTPVGRSVSPDILEVTPQSKVNVSSFLSRRASRAPKEKRVRSLTFSESEDEQEPVRKKTAGETKGALSTETVEMHPIFMYSDEELFGSYDNDSVEPVVRDLPILTPNKRVKRSSIYSQKKDDQVSSYPDLAKKQSIVKKTASKKTASKKTASKKTVSKKTASKETAGQTTIRQRKIENKHDRDSDDQSPPLLTPHVAELKPAPAKSRIKPVPEGMRSKSKADNSTKKKSTPSKSPEKILKKGKISPDITTLGCTAQRSLKPLTPLKPSSKRERRASSSSSVSSGSVSSNIIVGKEKSRNEAKRNLKGETPLHIACRLGIFDKVKQLVDTGANLNETDNAGWTPLHDAISGKGSTKEIAAIVRYLCEKGCNVNALGGLEDDTPLHEAAQSGIENVVEILLSFGASPNIRNSEGQLPKDVTSNENIVKMLNERSYPSSSGSVGFVEDRPALEISLSRAVVFFNFNVPKQILRKVEMHLRLKTQKFLTANVTHIIHDLSSENGDNGDVPLAWAYLFGIAHGICQFSYNWITKSLLESKCLNPFGFEITGCVEATNPKSAFFCHNRFIEIKGIPALARVNREKGNPGLFKGLSFYLYKTCAFGNLTKLHLSMLIEGADGKVIIREPIPDFIDPLQEPERFHVTDSNHKLIMTTHIILYHEKSPPPAKKKYNMEHVKTLRSDWVIDCIGNFALLDPEDYL